MPPGADRYEPLREAARQAENQAEHRQASQEETKKGPHEQRAVDAHAVQKLQAEIAENGPTRPTTAPNRSPGWTDSPRIEDQQHSANKFNAWVNASHSQRPQVPQQAKQNQEKPQDHSHSQQSPDDQTPPRSYADLKPEQSQTQKSAEQSEQEKEAAKSADAKKPVLTFNWDRAQWHEHER